MIYKGTSGSPAIGEWGCYSDSMTRGMGVLLWQTCPSSGKKSCYSSTRSGLSKLIESHLQEKIKFVCKVGPRVPSALEFWLLYRSPTV